MSFIDAHDFPVDPRVGDYTPTPFSVRCTPIAMLSSRRLGHGERVVDRLRLRVRWRVHEPTE